MVTSAFKTSFVATKIKFLIPLNKQDLNSKTSVAFGKIRFTSIWFHRSAQESLFTFKANEDRFLFKNHFASG